MSTNSIVELAEKLEQIKPGAYLAGCDCQDCEDKRHSVNESTQDLISLLPAWLKKLEALRDYMNEQCGDTFNNDCPCPVCISRRKLTVLLDESLEKP